MKHRNLRIAWSLAWGVVAVLLCLLWVRTNYWQDAIFKRTASQQVLIESAYGRATLTVEHQSVPFSAITSEWRHSAGPADIQNWPKEGQQFPAGMGRGFAYISRTTGFVAIAPYWSLTTFSVVLASLSWVTVLVKLRRFSLRTLLIATTIVASMLGLVAWALRR